MDVILVSCHKCSFRSHLLNAKTGGKYSYQYSNSNRTSHYRVHKCQSQWMISWASWVQYLPPHFYLPTSIIILSFHLQLGLSCSLFPSSFPTKIVRNFNLHTACYMSFPFHFIALTVQRARTSSIRNFVILPRQKFCLEFQSTFVIRSVRLNPCCKSFAWCIAGVRVGCEVAKSCSLFWAWWHWTGNIITGAVEF